MKILEVLPGKTVYDVLIDGFEDGPWQEPRERGPANLQIGRQTPLSSDKSRTHFPALQAAYGTPYDEMLFFDDSVWSDVSEGCRRATHAPVHPPKRRTALRDARSRLSASPPAALRRSFTALRGATGRGR